MDRDDETTSTTTESWPPEARFAAGDKALAQIVGKLREVTVQSAWWDPGARPPRWTYNLRDANGTPWMAGDDLMHPVPVEPTRNVAETWPPEQPSVVDPSLLAESPSRDAAVDLFGEPITRAADVMDPDAVPEAVPDAPAPPHGEAPPVPAGPSWSDAGWVDEGDTVAKANGFPQPAYAASEAPTITLADYPASAVAQVYDAEDAPTASGVAIALPDDPDLSWLGEPSNVDPFLTPSVVEEERTVFFQVEVQDAQRPAAVSEPDGLFRATDNASKDAPPWLRFGGSFCRGPMAVVTERSTTPFLT